MARCTIHTDYIQPDKTEEILQRCAKIISEALKNAPSGTAIPSGAEQNNTSKLYHKRQVV